MKNTFYALLLFILTAAPAWAGGGDPIAPVAAMSTEQAQVQLSAVTNYLTNALHLQSRQMLALRRYTDQELKLFNAVSMLQSSAPVEVVPTNAGSDTSYFEKSLQQMVTPEQFATFQRLKNTAPLATMLKSPAFVR